MDLHGLDRAARRVLAPERKRKALSAHRLVGVQQQHREHRARLDATQRDNAVAATGLKRTEDQKPHQPKLLIRDHYKAGRSAGVGLRCVRARLLEPHFSFTLPRFPPESGRSD